MKTELRSDEHTGEPKIALLSSHSRTFLAWLTFDQARELRDTTNDSLLEWCDSHQKWEEGRLLDLAPGTLLTAVRKLDANQREEGKR